MSKNTIPASVRFIHLRTPDPSEPRGGATLAYTSDTDKDDNKVVKIGVAFCHTRDNYNKKLGRVKAYGRLTQLNTGRVQHDGDRYFVIPDTEGDPRKIAEEIAAEIADIHGYARQHERYLGNFDRRFPVHPNLR